jgi:hypothetical protein
MVFRRKPSNGIPSEIVDRLGSATKRVLLIANNTEMMASDLPRDFCREDLIVEFNGCHHNASLLSTDCAKLFVFRAQEDRRVNFGYPPNPSPLQDVGRHQLHGQLYVLFVNNLPPSSTAPPVLRDVVQRKRTVGFVDSGKGIFASYPKPPGVAFAGPSTGFIVLQLLLELRRARSGLGEAAFEIVLVGFADSAGDLFWEGHNWAFERSFVQAHGRKLAPYLISI